MNEAQKSVLRLVVMWYLTMPFLVITNISGLPDHAWLIAWVALAGLVIAGLYAINTFPSYIPAITACVLTSGVNTTFVLGWSLRHRVVVLDGRYLHAVWEWYMEPAIGTFAIFLGLMVLGIVPVLLVRRYHAPDSGIPRARFGHAYT